LYTTLSSLHCAARIEVLLVTIRAMNDIVLSYDAIGLVGSWQVHAWYGGVVNRQLGGTDKEGGGNLPCEAIGTWSSFIR